MKRKNNDNLLIFKPHLDDPEESKAEEEPKLKTEQSASFSQEQPGQDEADPGDGDVNNAVEVRKSLAD